MSSVVFILYICGLLNNAVLFFWVYNSWSSPGRLNNIVLVQLFLNTWNIITHAAVELTRQHIWVVSATTFSFFSIYSLAALMLAAALGKPMQQRLNSKRNIIIFAVISSILLVHYGRRYELCRSENCFSPQLAYEDFKYAILKNDFAAFYVPTAVIFFGSWYLGFRSYMFSRVAVMERRQSCSKRCSLFCSNIAVSLFILYGLFVIDGILYFNDNGEITMSNHLCRMSCLHEELYVLLSAFPVYMGYFIKQNEGRLHQEDI
ncbi:hypothetical protein ACROYT_G044511 [Oculina patagonica]